MRFLRGVGKEGRKGIERWCVYIDSMGGDLSEGAFCKRRLIAAWWNGVGKGVFLGA